MEWNPPARFKQGDSAAMGIAVVLTKRRVSHLSAAPPSSLSSTDSVGSLDRDPCLTRVS